jgi:hypothetical protein
LSSLSASIISGNEVALDLEYNRETQQLSLRGYALPKKEQFSEEEKRNLYLAEAIKIADVPDTDRELVHKYFQTVSQCSNKTTEVTEDHVLNALATKRYKPVAIKTKPVYAELPDRFRIKREIKGKPLENLPKLNPCPPDFVPTGRYTQERKEIIDEVHKGDFLWPEEKKLVHHLMTEQNQAFAWDDTERGRFREDFFPPIIIPTVEHTPWVYRNIPIPSGIFNEVCKLVQKKIDAGVYEPSNASYRSRWFTVAKKDGKSLRIVHSLEPLNAVTIAHSGLPPATEELASNFAGRACGGMFDLYVGYDE